MPTCINYELTNEWWGATACLEMSHLENSSTVLKAADWLRNLHWCTGQTLDEAPTGPQLQASAKHRNNCVALVSQGRNKPPTTAWTIVTLLAQTFWSSSHNTIMLHCGNGWALPQTITRQPPLPCHLPAVFMPGLHYEV